MADKKKKELAIRSSAAGYLTFVASTGESDAGFEMRYEDENIWLTQKMMAALYDVGLPTANEHIKKIYADGELTEAATIRNFRIVQMEGARQVSREVIHYNLQAIIAVGFKVNNQRAVQFRKVTDLYATTFNYDKSAKTPRMFFQTIQNKMHFAVHRCTAAELIVERADAAKKHMGLATWENERSGW